MPILTDKHSAEVLLLYFNIQNYIKLSDKIISLIIFVREYLCRSSLGSSQNSGVYGAKCDMGNRASFISNLCY